MDSDQIAPYGAVLSGFTLFAEDLAFKIQQQATKQTTLFTYVSESVQRLYKPYPNDSLSGTLSVGPNMVNDSSFRALSHWQHVYGSQAKKSQAKPNPTDSIL